ncbi:hypothetical protein ODJ79_41060 [Actinoplanes sp. KI2]|uniref:hypothetical protein n=1 Tax=Actinoplanes sp. KI2 TaxID=2983315 RepID=UPI0021D58FA5|nr:hypothetical protein [Actinoplanes sp. KI2]MCU7730144.1 hypothetical protein [Actinoplanes sp. KI2]
MSDTYSCDDLDQKIIAMNKRLTRSLAEAGGDPDVGPDDPPIGHLSLTVTVQTDGRQPTGL